MGKVTHFRYIAMRSDGQTISGQMEARDRQAVLEHLDTLNCYPIEAVEVSAGPTSRLLGFRSRRPTQVDIALFTRELAWLLRAGLTLSRALEVLSEEAQLPRLGRTVAELRATIRAGQSFTEALSTTDSVFSDYYIHMVYIAESSDTLVPVLERIAEALDREQKIRRKIFSSLSYPALLMCMAVGTVCFILLSVVPSLKDVMLGIDTKDVPESTRRIIAASDWLVAHGWTLLAVVAGGTVLLHMLLRWPPLRGALYTASIRLPILGRLLTMALVVRFTRALATLLFAGVELPRALSLLRSAFGLKEMERVIDEMDAALRKGEDFLRPLAESWLVPPLLAKMMRVGSETGNLAPSVQQASAMFEEKLETAIQRSLTMLEPLIIVVVSLVIAAIISSIIGAIISVNELAL